MKVTSSVSPLAFTLEIQPRNPERTLARFHQNAEYSTNTRENGSASGWEYDEYCLEFPTSYTLEAEIEAHYGEYLKRAMEAEGASEAEYISVARNAALERIGGKCSAAIYSGVDVNGKHYTLSKNEQDALAIAQTKVDKGATVVLYGDGLKDAATITAISAAAYEWGVVCTTYYAYLKQYIAAETDVDKLAAIDFGKALPDSYIQQLAALLSSAGIDITKYAAALTGG